MRTHRIGSRPHIQGSCAPLRLCGRAGGITDGAGLVLLRHLWDRLDVGAWLDSRTRGIAGVFRPSLMLEILVALLWYGGGALDHVSWLGPRNIRRIFGWVSVPDPTTFGRWLRRAGEALVPLLDQLLWHIVVLRWRVVGVPERVTLLLDSTVSVRYGQKQAGAEVGYNPKKHGRPSHHPMVAFLQETGDCAGERWRPGNAHTADGAIEWLELLVVRLRAAGVSEITVRLDKGFFSRAMVNALQELGVSFLLKVPDYPWLRRQLGARRQSEKDPAIWTASGTLYGVRLLSCEWRKALLTEQGTLRLDTYEVTQRAHVLTNLEGIHALTAWRLYNQGAVVEQRIAELGQLAVGDTAIDHLEGNALLWQIGALAYQLLHYTRTTALPGDWQRAQPERLRAALLRMPAKLTTHSRKHSLRIASDEPQRHTLRSALSHLARLAVPPLPRAA
ncbi:MAG: IS1380 family transposase [Longimicrobiales bacterium]